MTFLVDSSVKVAAIVLVSLGVAACLRRRAAAARHWVLAVGIACAIAIPGLTLVVPSWSVARRATAPAASHADAQSSVTTTIITQNTSWRSGAAAAGISTAAPAAGRTSAPRLIALIWLAGAAIAASILLVGLARLRVVAAAARRIDSGPWSELADEMARVSGLRRPIVLLQSDHPTLLVTWGWRRPRVILPAAARLWTRERARIVLCHEFAHIRRGDWTAQMLGELLRAVYWFNPLVRIACRRLRRESEQACDDAVLHSGVDPTDYASHLLDLARTLNAGRSAYVPAPAMARPSSLEGRIGAMLNARLDRRPLTRAAQVANAAVLLVATLSIAGAAAQARYSTLSGTVVDQTNGFLPNTTMVLTNAASRARYEVRTDATGHFEFVGLPPGEYTLQVTQLGFAGLTEPVAITGRDLSRTIQLQIGSLEETITLVSGPATPAKADPDRAGKLQALRDKAQERQLRATQHCAVATSGGVGGNILVPWKIRDVKPIYPETASSTRVGGVVTMEALIGTDGTVREVSVISSPHPDLDRAAAEAVRQWEFTPTILNCTAVDVRMKVTANFVVRQ
jgi:TonB family protein